MSCRIKHSQERILQTRAGTHTAHHAHTTTDALLEGKRRRWKGYGEDVEGEGVRATDKREREGWRGDRSDGIAAADKWSARDEAARARGKRRLKGDVN